MTPIDVVVLKCRKICRLEILKSFAIYRTKKTNFGSLSNCRYARISPKICLGQPPTMSLQCFRFHPNRFTIGGVIAERVNTFLPRKVFPL